jgi:alkylation response protein AidB-like acyl-CoA dehydrogenase
MWRHEDELQSMLRESVDRYAAGNDTVVRFRDKRRSTDGFDRKSWRDMAELGWTGALLPEEAGGAALDILPVLSLAEAVGRNLIPEPFVASAVIAATILAASQAPAARALATALAAGEAVVVLADQEEIGAIEPAAARTSVAALDGGGYALTGSKIFVPAWTDDTRLLVSATFEGHPVVMAVDAGAAGVAAGTHRMTDGTVCAHLTFDKVALATDALILRGSDAAEAIRLALARGTIALAAQLEGAARRLLSMTGDYLTQRAQFEKPLASFQSVRHGLVSQHLQIEFAGASWRSAAASLQGGLTAEASMRISAAKARCADAALGMGKSAIHYHGAFGFTEEADIGLYVNAILRWASWLGNADAHRQRALSLSREQQPPCN